MTKEEQEREAAQLEQKREEVKVSDAQADHWSRLDGEGVELQFATVLCKNWLVDQLPILLIWRF